MGWLSNLINKAKKKTEKTVQSAVQQGQQAVQNAVQNVSSGYGNWLNGVEQQVGQTVQQGKQAVQGAVQQGQQIVQNTVQNTSQAVTDKVNNINNQIQGNTPGTQVQTPVQSAPIQAAQNPVTPTQPTEIPQQGTLSQAPTVEPPTQTPTVESPVQTDPSEKSETFDSSEPILSYEEYLKQEEKGLGYINNQTTQLIDKQVKDTLKHIDEALTSGNKHIIDVKETTDAALKAEKDEVYKYAEETLAGALGYNEEAYGKLVEAITGQMEAGKLAASEAKNLLMIMAEEVKNTTYGAAERHRQEAERQADINRQRAIADANSAYEQNKASYGANAEALGNMGLTAGGYGEWLNASAYAQNRSEVQGARAQSDAEKREAKYTEDMTKLEADQEYSNKKYQAESEYQNKLYDIDISYRTNMSEAEQSKLAADKAAYDTERDTKRKADDRYNAGMLESDVTYKEMLHQNEQTAKDKKLEVTQSGENSKLNAEISYVEGILGNSKALAEYKESLKAGDAAAEEKKLAIYEQLLKGVNDGTYTAEDAAALSDAFGLDKEWKDAIANSAGNKAEADANAKAEREQMQNRQDYTSVLLGVANGELDEATATALSKEYGFSKEQTDAIIKAAQGRANGETGDIFIDTLINASNGKLDEATATAIAKQYGFDEEQTKAVVQAVQGAADKVLKEQRTHNFNTLLDKAKTGTLTKDEVMQMASELGFDVNNSDDKKLLDLIGSAADRFATATEEEKKYQKNMNVLTLLEGAKTGAYGANEIDNIAGMLGLDLENDAGLINMIKTAAGDYADGVTKSEEQQKMNSFINLLGSANVGELTADELNHIAGELGLSDDQKALLTTAAGRYQTGSEEEKAKAKTMSFISLLDGANTGAYNSDQIAQMAEMLGLDPENEDDANLIDMLKTAANDFAAGEAGKTAKEDKQYQNTIYAELLAAANNGDYTEEQARDLVKRFGLDEMSQELVGDAASLAKENIGEAESKVEKQTFIENKNAMKAYITGDTTDEEIDSLLDDGYIGKDEAEELKTYRNNQGIKEINSMVKSGDYVGAAERADELLERGVINTDTYQKTYFDISIKDCNGLNSIQDIEGMIAELSNREAAGKISKEDAESLTKYLYATAGNAQKISITNDAVSTNLEVGHEKIQVTSKLLKYFSEPEQYVQDILDRIAKENGGANSVMLEGVLYVNIPNASNAWKILPTSSDSTAFYNEYINKGGQKAKTEAPSHYVIPTKTYNGGNINKSPSGSVSGGGDYMYIKT